MLFLVASAAIILPLVLLAGLKLPAKYGMPISMIVVAVLALTVWGMEPLATIASGLQGIHRTISILWILFGAILLLKVLQVIGAMQRIKRGFEAISPDMRVQAVLIGVTFVAVLEGLTGFGAPMTIAAPLLLALGFRPVAAIVIALIGDTAPVVFGAVGTPVVIGLSNVPSFGEPDFFMSISRAVTTVDFAVAVLLPLIAVTTLVKFFGENKHSRSMREVWEVAPWALMVGLMYALSAFAAAFFMSPELIAVAAGVMALVFATITARYNILLAADLDWRTHVDKTKLAVSGVRDIPLFAAWAPYMFVIVGLVATRLVPPVREAALSHLDASWSSILGYANISSQWQFLYSPGTIMVLAALFAAGVFVASRAELATATKSTGSIVVSASLALFPALIMVQVFTNSGINTSDLAAMPIYIASQMASVFQGGWLAAAPVLGALGAFIAGSSTVSALTMAEIQYSVAKAASLSPQLVLAGQLSGSAAGNMIAVHNIIAASAVVGIYHQEGKIIRRMLPIVAIYLALSIASAFVISAFGLFS
jgi:lactate permease